MKKIRHTYGNTASSGFTIDFFENAAVGAKNAYLASPFFTTIEPIKKLTNRGCNVQLLVRLCSITPPAILREAMVIPNVAIRYFTSRNFHTKLYIIDDVALVGSANLTESGLMTNREVSVVLRKEIDLGFDSLPVIFESYWEFADVLDKDILAQYELAYKYIGKAKEEEAFQKHLEKFVDPAIPPSAKAGSSKVSKRRSFIQNLRRKYDERLNPAFSEVEAVFLEYGKRRDEFSSGDVEIELGRFLGWLRILFAPKDTWKETPLLNSEQRKERIIHYIDEWVAADDTKAGDMYYADLELANIALLRDRFSSLESINGLNYDQIFEALTKVHAFHDRLRFVSGGLDGLYEQFRNDNQLARIKETIIFLLHGSGMSLDRAYDCIHDKRHYLAGIGENCVMELLGWIEKDRPPINGRTIKALRFLGYDVNE